MNPSESTKAATISLNDLLALNDEIVALTRAGVPLEPSLSALGKDLPGRLGQTAQALAERSARGESIANILAQRALGLPPVYQAVVEAGLRAGRLPAALETVAGSIRRTAETRRGVAAAALYPLFVLILACGFFAFFTIMLAPTLHHHFQQLDLSTDEPFAFLSFCGQWVGIWGPGIPLIILVAGGLWWSKVGKAGVLDPHRSGRLLGWLPWMGKAMRWTRTATFADLLALLVENQVPLHEAIVLASEASGDHGMKDACRELAASLQQGRMPDAAKRGNEELPPMLRWMIASGQRHGALLPALKHAAATYHRRAQYQADMACIFLPVLMTIFVGGAVTLIYAVSLFLPYATLLKGLGAP